jgi:hypothetical protein
LENSPSCEKKKDLITSITAGKGRAWRQWQLPEILPSQRKIGFMHGIGLHLIRKLFGMSGLKEEAAGAVEEQSPQEGLPWNIITSGNLRNKKAQ